MEISRIQQTLIITSLGYGRSQVLQDTAEGYFITRKNNLSVATVAELFGCSIHQLLKHRVGQVRYRNRESSELFADVDYKMPFRSSPPFLELKGLNKILQHFFATVAKRDQCCVKLIGELKLIHLRVRRPVSRLYLQRGSDLL